MRVTRPRGGAATNDEGFTLVEVVMTVAILGIIAAALCGVVLQYLRTSGTTDARLTESTDQQFVSAYWQADVSSLGQREFPTPVDPGNPAPPRQSVFLGSAGPGACGPSVGNPVVTFAWTDFPVDAEDPHAAWTPTRQKVVYATIDPPPGGAPYVLVRIRCRGETADQPQTVARNLTKRPVVECDTPCGAATPPNQVSMTITVKDPTQPGSPGYTTTLTADRRQG